MSDSTPTETGTHARTDLSGFAGVLFDLDGVLTPTAEVHMYAWRSMFTEVFARLGIEEPYTDDDYFASVDGKPRYDGVTSVLASRGVVLVHGHPDDPSDLMTVCGIGNRKNEVFARILEEEGVLPFPGSLALVDWLRASGVPLGVVSSSRNARSVLAAARIADRFEIVVDGVRAEQEGLSGKPAPDMFRRGAELLGVPPETSAAVEDALSGVRSAASGGFRLVVGVDRGVGRARLGEAGADLVVDDLAELLPVPHRAAHE